MRAVIVRAFGGPDVLEHHDVPTPDPGPGQVRIRVQAAAVNPVDAATRTGDLTRAGLMAERSPIGIGWDAAGTIDATGPGVTAFAAGDAVIGLRDRLDVPLGAYAQHLVLDAAAVAPAPAGVPPEQAATLPLNALTAWQSLDTLDLPEGATLLVTGAAGALGAYAVELAAQRGLRVAATAAAADEAFVRGLGATWFVPRTTSDLPADVRAHVPGGVDGALDAAVIGARALEAVRNRGAFVAVVGGGAPFPLRGTRVTNVWISADGDQLTQISELAASGRLTMRVADVLPLKDAAHAHQRLQEGGLRGRLILTP
ncbi:NADP-dependent oxidoreductase [Actinomadura barringtoniae]|uniref:NADP-dependent oxidoreductase n=1 Tax=Actinomadura barringtoniae TaxID=1427535 RepID=A0A939PMD8_9ACTN|nr:NADP-dependent oxidoreductase [Actinomadura barringtoniae]MBO2454738.1 NADP-dependent oxidoreductase [Actinomadura barringtoniae]